MSDKEELEYERPEMTVFPGYAKLVCGATGLCSAVDVVPPDPGIE